MSTAAPHWRLRLPAPPSAVEHGSALLNVHPQVAAVLWSRGYRDFSTLELNPPFEVSAIPQLPKAAARLALAIQRGERILVHGDHDADGITATAVLTLGLRSVGARAETFIPNRLNASHGLSLAMVDAHAQACDVLITVDCGIGDLEAIEALQARGVEVIITDHHTPSERLPNATVVHAQHSLRAKRGLPEMTGAGVAFHVVWALHQQLGLETPITLTDIAAIGTVGDVGSLLGENRALVREGLAQMQQSVWPGVRALLRAGRIHGSVTPDALSFQVVPKLNAAARLGQADLALKLLMTADDREALRLAAELDAFNRDRKALQAKMLREALALVNHDDAAVVLVNDNWHVGLLGPVANKVLEQLHKPVLLFSSGRGSVRVPSNMNAVALLTAARAHLLGFGGHPAAAGCSLDMANLESVVAAVQAFVAQQPRPDPALLADALIPIALADRELLAAVNVLEPAGHGNRPVTFAITGEVRNLKPMGDGSHMSLNLENGSGSLRTTAFHQGHLGDSLLPGMAVDVHMTLSENDFRGKSTIEARASHVRPAGRWQVGDEHAAITTATGWVTRGNNPGALVIDPEADDILAPVRAAWDRGEPLVLAPPALQAERWWQEINAWPTPDQVLKGWKARVMGAAIPFAEPLLGRVHAALIELGLLDEGGNARRKTKAEPFQSSTLRRGLTRRYLLWTLWEAFERLDDAGFEATVVSLAELPG